MSQYLLDTNVCIDYMKGKFSVGNKIDEVGIENCFLSEITCAELLFGAYKGNRSSMDVPLVKEFISQFEIIPITSSIEVYAHNKAELEKAGTPIDDLDLFIGSSAIANGFIMVTENVKHFELQEGITIENWADRRKE